MTMAPAQIDHYFEKAFLLANNTVLTVEAPDCEEELLKLLESAMLRGFDNHARLTEIHLPMERFPSMDSKFWHVPIEDCGKAQVLRFFFEHPDTEAN
jgi:hypothetical protein